MRDIDYIIFRCNKKRAPKTFVLGALIKEGGYLLSRIALQYHRRWRA